MIIIRLVYLNYMRKLIKRKYENGISNTSDLGKYRIHFLKQYTKIIKTTEFYSTIYKNKMVPM